MSSLFSTGSASAKLRELLEELTTACEKDFCGPLTETCNDDEAVVYPDSPITFGLIRRCRAALGAVDVPTPAQSELEAKDLRELIAFLRDVQRFFEGIDDSPKADRMAEQAERSINWLEMCLLMSRPETPTLRADVPPPQPPALHKINLGSGRAVCGKSDEGPFTFHDVHVTCPECQKIAAQSESSAVRPSETR